MLMHSLCESVFCSRDDFRCDRKVMPYGTVELSLLRIKFIQARFRYVEKVTDMLVQCDVEGMVPVEQCLHLLAEMW